MSNAAESLKDAIPVAVERQLSDAESLIDYVKTRDLPCPGCGYNLRQLQSVTCPECGQQLKLTIGLVDHRIGAWIACVLGCSFPAGLGCIVIGVAVINLDEVMRDLNHIPWQMALLIAYFLLMLTSLIALLIKRRQFLQMSRQSQRLFGSAPWASMAVVFMILFFG